MYLNNLKRDGLLPSFINIVDMVKCTGMLNLSLSLITIDKSHLQEYFEKVHSKGGEGVMLREAKSLYKGGRSDSLKKFKSYLDSEVKVIENNYPHGFVCELYSYIVKYFTHFKLVQMERICLLAL